MKLLYRIGILAYGLGIRVASLFHKKARLWVKGRRNWEEKLASGIAVHMGKPVSWIWFHCSSLGEFEQGRPLIEEIRHKHPELKILLTFFSPSGYEIRKNFAHADHVCYMPLDTTRNANRLLDLIQPRLIIFVKYDLWLNHLSAIHARGIPMVLISALVRPESRFLNSMLKSLYRTAFRQFARIYTQDEESQTLLQAFSEHPQVRIAGDTRFDRVVQLPDRFEEVPGIAEFKGERRCVVIGSSWPQDEQLLLKAIEELRDDDLRWIIAPHEIHMERIDRMIGESAIAMGKYSRIRSLPEAAEVLWIDNVGMLSRLYAYADIVYIGGGFGKSIHNTQEPAVYGRPVVFGPKYTTFREAVDMVEAGGAFSISDESELIATLRQLLDDAELRTRLGAQNGAYMRKMAGATARIYSDLTNEGFL